MKDVDKERQRAEVFDALAHPTRISILKALDKGPLGFADLKKKLKIESSGHLQHHLSKLSDLIKTDEHGKYCLSAQGKDALFAMQTVEKTAKPTKKEAEGVIHAYSSRERAALTVLVVSLAAASLVSGFYISNLGLVQSQYFYDVVEGSLLQEDASRQISSSPFEMPVGYTCNFTAMVFSTLNPPATYYVSETFATLVLPPPMINSTYYRLGFVGFHVTLTLAKEQTTNDTLFTAYFGPVTGPKGWNEEQVINPYENPPYKAGPIQSYSVESSDGLQIANSYIIPITVFGNYTFRIADVGNTTMKAQFWVWASTVTMETKPLRGDETFLAITDAHSERVVRIYRRPTTLYLVATTIAISFPAALAASSVYLLNRKR